jgi:hypothetical protein
MRSELSWIEVNAADPPRDEARILARGQRPIRASATRKQALPRLEAAAAKIVVERLPGLLSQFEPDGPSGLLLANVCQVDSVAVGRHVIASSRTTAAPDHGPPAHDIARAKNYGPDHCIETKGKRRHSNSEGRHGSH